VIREPSGCVSVLGVVIAPQSERWARSCAEQQIKAMARSFRKELIIGEKVKFNGQFND
jgi:hypothetical protein